MELEPDRYYLLIVLGGVEITVEGPFVTHEGRMDRAREVWGELDSAEDNIFCLTIGEDGEPRVASFLEGELDE